MESMDFLFHFFSKNFSHRRQTSSSSNKLPWVAVTLKPKSHCLYN